MTLTGGGNSQSSVAIDPVTLELVERLGSLGGGECASIAANVASELGVPNDDLAALAGQMESYGWLGRRPDFGTPQRDTSDLPSPPADDEHLTTITPLVLAVGADGFVHLGHDGTARETLSAREVVVAAELADGPTATKAFEAQRTKLGERALSRPEFDQLAQRLLAVGLLEAPNRPGAVVSHQKGKLAAGVKKYLARVAELRKVIERRADEHEANAADSPVPVLPVHSTPNLAPLSLGMLIAHARKFDNGALTEHYDLQPHWLIAEDMVREVASRRPGVFLFSNYVWNHAMNISLSALVKEVQPNSITIHGGPDTPSYVEDAEAYFADNPHVDIAVRGEGEQGLAEVLAALVGHVGDGAPDLSALADVPGLTYRDGDRVVRTDKRERLTDINVIPSPYLEGLFDVYGEVSSSSAIIETNRGCPYGCTFCDWGSATNSRIRKFDLDRVLAELEWCAQHEVSRVWVADANFGIIERDVEIAEKVAALKREYGYPREFHTNYAKNTVKHLKRIVEVMADVGILTNGLLSLQSMDDDTLDTIRRSNIKLEKYEDLAREFRKAELPLYVDLMVGLPGSTLESFKADLQQCVDREVVAKIHQTELLVNSPMNEPQYRAQNRIETSVALKPGTGRSDGGFDDLALVVSTSTYSRADYDEMMDLRRLYFFFENFGTLRQVARYVRQETGMPEVAFYDRMRALLESGDPRYPTLVFVLATIPDLMVAPASWRLFVDDVGRFLVDELGVADDSALDTVLAVQLALLPDRDRSFPERVELPHDYAAWHAAMLDAKDGPNRETWTQQIPRLCDLQSGHLDVDDPGSVCQLNFGFSAPDDYMGDWELASQVSRPMPHYHLTA